MNNDFYQELITTLECKFDQIEQKIDNLMTKMGLCYLCGDKPPCNLTNCPHENKDSNPN